MKRLIILYSILFLIIVGESKAQFRVGVVAYPQIGSLMGIIPFKRHSLNTLSIPTLGWGSMVWGSYENRKHKGIQFGAGYSAQNQNFLFKYKIGDIEETHRGKKRFDYLKFFAAYRNSWLIGKFARSYFFAGGQYSHLLLYDGGMIVYQENSYFDLPPTPPGNPFYKKFSADVVVGWGIEFAKYKHFDFVAGWKLDVGVLNVERTGLTYNGIPVFDFGGSRPYTLAFNLGVCYLFHRRDHILLPTNTYRFRVYQKRRINPKH